MLVDFEQPLLLAAVTACTAQSPHPSDSFSLQAIHNEVRFASHTTRGRYRLRHAIGIAVSISTDKMKIKMHGIRGTFRGGL
jgi:hypothetical protein